MARRKASHLPPLELEGRTLLGRYRVEQLIGRGGMGAVWKGEHTFTGRAVALKVLDRKYLTSPSVVGRFDREARAASAIHHEGIVEILDVDVTEEGVPFLVMEHLNGETLSTHIARGRMSQRDMLGIALPLLDALSAAHAKGVVHRDLKPENLILVPHRKGFRLKLLDFGISHKEDEIDANLTTPGAILGTPHYMSPEQALGEPLDWRVDIYGAGVVLYECIVGGVPFDGTTYHKLLRQIIREPPTPPSERGADIEDDVEAVLLHALQKLPRNRPQTAREMRDELIAAARGELPTRVYSSNPPMVRRSGVTKVDRDALVSALGTTSSYPPPLPAPRSPTPSDGSGEGFGDRTVLEFAETLASDEPYERTSATDRSAEGTAPDALDLPVSLGPSPRPPTVSSGLVPRFVAAAALVLMVGVGVRWAFAAAPSSSVIALNETVWVTVSFDDLPSDASILLDGIPGTLPLRLRAGTPYAVTVRAPGFVDYRISVVAESDLTLTVDMQPRANTE